MKDRVDELETDVAGMRTDVATIKSNYATKSDVADLRADLHKISSDISRWTLASMISIIGVGLAAIFGLAQVYKNAIPPAQHSPAPIIVTVPVK